ncbi:2-isopropylmalate synthase [Algiphilus sp.]|uniref:2-isopropylmalate synthase n=2 Tax=Algiphilus sp. TaxID=1872431 RepID=UPI0025C29B27|nr:2-isopropylmalate synthase [Algiphilus sp.]MCK5771619.1 2-isopropylmalate synthase [Algiphilus sp.]
MLDNPAVKYRAFAPVGLKDRRWCDAVITKPPIWASVDLRDGNQALIEPMDFERKQRMFDALVAIGFKEIEVGFPSASQTDFDFIRRLIEEDRVPEDVTIQVLTQAREHLIRRTFESLRGARRAIVHVYNATAPIMRKVVFSMGEDEVIGLAVHHAEMLRDIAATMPETDWVFQYSPEMYSGTELDFSRRIVDAVTEVWQPTPEKPCIVNLPATVEHSTPNIFADMVEWTHRNIARRDAVILSVHPHNDRGTGVAAAEFAIMAGADRIEGCLFGNGERTGNVDVVNLALNMYTQGVHPGLDFSDIDAIKATVEHCNQLPVHPRHPYVGELVFTSFSGSHQDAIKKALSARGDKDDVWDMPYLPIDPRDVGRTYEAVIRVNSQSGKGGVSYLLETEYGLRLPRRLQIEFSHVIKHVTDDTGKELTAADIHQVFEDTYITSQQPYAYVGHHFVEDSRSEEVHLTGEIRVNGDLVTLEGRGNGPIDAFVGALSQRLGVSVTVMDYHEHALGEGAKARAATYIDLRVGDQGPLFGVGIDPNIVTASLKAVLSGLNRAMAQQVKAA